MEEERAHRRRSQPWCEKGRQKSALERGLKILQKTFEKGFEKRFGRRVVEECWRRKKKKKKERSCGVSFWGLPKLFTSLTFTCNPVKW